MAYVTLEYLKKQLNIEPDFTDDDDYIMLLEKVSEQVVEKYADYPLEKYEDENHKLPEALNHAIALFVATQYAVRESISGTNYTANPHSLELLVDLYRNYTIDKE